MLGKVKQNRQRGAVSLFVVVFFALMITVVTIGFIVLMVRNQKLATNNDLSQSAYDSALAGAEDGKRIIKKYLDACSDETSADCTEWRNIITNQTCLNLPNKAFNTTEDKEIKVLSGEDLAQAYTCLKIKMDTPDYLGQLDQGSNELIPLRGVSEFDKIEISWFSKKDLADGASLKLDSVSGSNEKLMIDKSDWGNRPAVLKAQLIQYNSYIGFEVTDFDNNTHNSSLYLYPSSNGVNDASFDEDGRRSAGNAQNILKNIKCESFSPSGYACKAKITLPEMDNREAYLNLTTFYAPANFKVALLDSADGAVKFSAVQPEIDSTGRANDLFRRVKVRANLFNTKGLTGVKAVEILNSGVDTGDFKKNFTVNP